MILKKPINLEVHEQVIELKTKQHKTALFDLVNRVQPGYFNNKTSDLGKYFGKYKKRQINYRNRRKNENE